MNVVIAAGGTGGHVFPAVALAEEFCRQDPRSSITLVGTGRGLEQMMLKQSTVRLETLQVRGVVGQGFRASMRALVLVPRAVSQAAKILRSCCAQLVIGTGGYTTPPVVLAAFLLGIPRALLEPNAIPGMANRVMGPLANKVFVALDPAVTYFTPTKTQVVGTPIRHEFTTVIPEPHSGHIHTLLVVGGSQGATAINAAVTEAVAASSRIREQIRIIHQTGAHDCQWVREAYESVGVGAEVVPFLSDMPGVLRRADLVISRCGALTLAEIAACGKPSILIPFPFAAHQHQEKNARAIEQAGAAIVFSQDKLTGTRLAREIEQLLDNPSLVKRMAGQSAALRKLDSAEVMVRACRELVSGAAGVV